jgi:hypothetical protein
VVRLVELRVIRSRVRDRDAYKSSVSNENSMTLRILSCVTQCLPNNHSINYRLIISSECCFQDVGRDETEFDSDLYTAGEPSVCLWDVLDCMELHAFSMRSGLLLP